jgi:hypothetical protein
MVGIILCLSVLCNYIKVPYVENTLYSTNKYSCVRRVHTHYISDFVEHNRDDEPHDSLFWL